MGKKQKNSKNSIDTYTFFGSEEEIKKQEEINNI